MKNKQCNLTLKTKDGPLRTVLCFPEKSLDLSTGEHCKILAPLSHLRAVCTYVNRVRE